MEERIEHIIKLQNSNNKHEPRQSMVLGNFYTIVTIAAVSISILYYVNYIQPVQKIKEEKLLAQQKHEQFIQERAKRIALSHKMNATRESNETP